MLKLFRVTEKSMAPLFQPGDLAVASRLPLLGRGYPAPGSVVIFQQKYYGKMIKQVERVLPERDEIYVIGTSESSVDSREFGPIHKSEMIGKVIWRIRRPSVRYNESSQPSQPDTAVAHHPPVSPYLVLFIGILAVSTASIFIRYAQEFSVPSLVIAAFRLSLASLVLSVPALIRYQDQLKKLKALDLLLALLSGFFLALHFAFWITSLEATSVASSVVLVTTTPLWVALLAPFTVKEKITRFILAGMVMALAGGAIIAFSDTCSFINGGLSCPSLNTFFHAKAFIADLLALGGATMASLYLLIGRGLRKEMSLIPYIFVVYGMAALVLIVIMLVARQSPLGYPPKAYVWLVLLALIPQLIGHSTFNWALRYLPTAFVSITLLGEPIGSTILAYFLLSEKPTVLKLFGAILILAGIVIASRPPSPRTEALLDELE